MNYFKGNSFASIYEQILRKLMYEPQYVVFPRNLKIHEMTGVSMEIENPYSACYDNKRRSTQYKYIAAELVWYFSGDNEIDFISKYAKFWKNITNPDGITVNSAYGYLLFNRLNEYYYSQYMWALQSLIDDKDTRQAILHFNTPDHQFKGNKDFVCTMYGIFHIRENKLDFNVYMRSNDAILGLPTDIAFFTILQQQMLSHLRKNKYPDLKMGKYVHHDDSLHLYEKNFELVKEMLEHEFIPSELPRLKEDFINDINSDMNYHFEDISKLIKVYNYDDPSIFKVEDELLKWIIENLKS